jgi:hypothetical protein
MVKPYGLCSDFRDIAFKESKEATTYDNMLAKFMGAALHCQVEHHAQDKKKSTFSKLHHQNGSKFYHFFFMSIYTISIT